ncbi:putative methyltransferase-domain-containing protein [Spinellus fusiger]|nr:putative methyltransferase-domain-containing protein [Spinellus fusiger]
MAESTQSDIMSDEAFRQKLEAHFALYRLNLRFPLVSHVIPNQWYRMDLLLVNEVGLFRRADIEPDGTVNIGCEIRIASQHSMAPLCIDPSWSIETRPAHSWERGVSSLSNTAIPGFQGSGRGALEYRIVFLENQEMLDGPRYLRFFPTKLQRFPKNTDKPDPNTILPLMVGPIHITSTLQLNHLSYFPLEYWPKETEMVYDTFRLFGTDNNIVIHEAWDSGIPGKIWDSALVMLEFLKRMSVMKPDYLHEKHSVDLSAGTGLLGLYLASLGKKAESRTKCKRITITEIDDALELIHKNVELNNSIRICNLKETLFIKPLLWGNAKEAAECGKADVILASDVLYESEFFEDLVKAFVDLSTESTKIYIGYKRRGFEATDEQRFWALCEEYFDVVLLTPESPEDVDSCLIPPVALVTSVHIYRLTRNKNS